jgi:hypothetical protein
VTMPRDTENRGPGLIAGRGGASTVMRSPFPGGRLGGIEK